MTDEDERDPLEQLDGPQQGGEPNASPSAHKQRVSRIEREEREETEFWRGILADEVGRRVIWKYIAHDLRAFGEPFAYGPNGFPQPEATWFEAGLREAGRRLYQRLGKYDRDNRNRMEDENDPYFKKPKSKKGN
jgi:hypothetical protein